MSLGNATFLSILLAAQVAAASWNIEKIDRAALGNRVVQLKITENGDKHLVYTGCSDQQCAESHLFYALQSGNYQWEATAIDNSEEDTGWFPSLSFDNNGIAHIFYADHYKESLRYATNASGSWELSKPQSGRGGWWTSTAAANGRVYMAHTKLPKKGWDNAVLEVGTLQNGEWTFETVDAARNAGWFTSMAVTPGGDPVVSYNSVFNQPVGSIKVAIKKDNAWDIVDIDGVSVKHHVTVDNRGFIHLVYNKMSSISSNKYPDGLRDFMYATNANGSWSKMKIQLADDNTIFDSGNFPRIIADANGGLHVTYILNREAVMYGYKAPGRADWVFETVDKMGTAIYPWLEQDRNGKIHIAYERGGNIYLASQE